MKISVVIPTHNRKLELKRAIDSVFNQTLLPNELIVIDDGSLNPIGKDIFKNAPDRINTKLLRNEKPKGANNARNIGIKESTSDWIAFLDDDDQFIENKIEVVSSYMHKYYKDFDFFYHSAKYIMVNEGVYYNTHPEKLNNKKDIFKQLIKKNYVGATSMVTIKKSILLEVGGFDENLPAVQDFELWLNLAKKNRCRFLLINEVLTNYYTQTNKKSISKSIEKMNFAFSYIEEKHSLEFKKCNQEQIKNFEQLKMGMIIHKAYLNKNKLDAIRLNFQAFVKFHKIKYLIGSFVSVFDLKFILLIRKHISISR